MNGLERLGTKYQLFQGILKMISDILFQQTKESFINMELKREADNLAIERATEDYERNLLITADNCISSVPNH
jgi:hypothetical protein